MTEVLESAAVALHDAIIGLEPLEALRFIANAYPQRVVFSTSFSNEDQVITDLIHESGAAISIFTLDTGRLFEQVYSTWASTNEYYNIQIKAYTPDASLLQQYLDANGPNAFYSSVSNRKQCCHIRKVEPLKKALNGNSVWITGLRSAHSVGREQLSSIEWDDTNKIIKYNPLVEWSHADVKEYIRAGKIPYNIMHDNGYPSIGCAPCTRAVREGEDFRAGRWWWEDENKKECGLHIKQQK
jgi:phosphoadenosine phosphosulfate reductase